MATFDVTSRLEYIASGERPSSALSALDTFYIRRCMAGVFLISNSRKRLNWFNVAQIDSFVRLGIAIWYGFVAENPAHLVQS